MNPSGWLPACQGTVVQGNDFPMRQAHCELRLNSLGRGFYEITRDVESFVKESGIRTGLVTLFVRHTSASLLIQENADPSVRLDLERFMARIVPDGDRIFQHRAEGIDDMPAHVRTALTAVSVGIPVVNGEMVLGTWQGLYLWEHRKAAQTRRIVVHVIGE